MAKSKSSSSRKSSAKKAAETKAARQQQEQRRRELTGLGLVAGGVLLGIYTFVSASGVLGEFLRTFIFGMFGWFAYGIPFVLVGAGIVCIAGRQGNTKGGTLWLVVGILDIMTLAQTATNPEYEALQYTKYISNAYTSGGQCRGGGVIGAILCYPLQQMGGNALCYVFTILILLFVVLMLTRFSIRDIGATFGHRVSSAVTSAVSSAREYVATATAEAPAEGEKKKRMRIFTLKRDEDDDEEEPAGEGDIESTPHLQTAGDAAGITKPATAKQADEEESHTRRSLFNDEGDLTAFNAFAADLPVSETPRKVKDEPVRGSHQQQELTYLADTDLRARPVRTLAPEKDKTTARTPVAETDLPKGDSIWEDLEPAVDYPYETPQPKAATQGTTSRAAAASSAAAPVAGVKVTTDRLATSHGDIRAKGRMSETDIQNAASAMFTSVSGTAAGAHAVATASKVKTVEPLSDIPAFLSVAAGSVSKQDAAKKETAPAMEASHAAAAAPENQVRVPNIPEEPSEGDEDMTPEEALQSLRRPLTAPAPDTATATAPAASVTGTKDAAPAATGAAQAKPAAPVADTKATAPAGQDAAEAPEEEIVVEAPKPYAPPPLSLLNPPTSKYGTGNEDPEKTGQLLIETLESFGISATLTDYSVGPVITRFELQPAKGVRVNRITALSNDIALALAASRVRIEAPIPGKAAVGIEIPNKHAVTVVLRDIIESKEFQQASSPITLALGKDTGGQVLTADLAKMPHLLIAGSTGSGKSVCINDLLISMVYKTSPEDLRLILIDPKVVELSVFGALPHLLVPVVTDPKRASGALHWAVNEMILRYKKFSDVGSRDLARYNALQSDPKKRLPKLVVIIDELADLMMVAPDEVEDSICRIAQLGRAAGIHLIVATQRPSADIITGLIKANIPSRCAFAVSSGIDSRIILDETGAEKLLGRGDMLFHANGSGKPVRAQAAFVSDEEVEAIMDYFRGQNQAPKFDENIEADLANAGKEAQGGNAHGEGKQEDELLGEAVRIVMESGQASISMIQRRLRVGYARAARLVDMMEQEGYVSGFEGSKPRRVLIKRAEFERIFGDGSYQEEEAGEPAGEEENGQ